MELSSLLLLLIFAAISSITWTYLIHPIFLSPLSKIPAAHPFARITDLWITYTRYSRHELSTIHAAHEKLGPVILLGPNEISVNCIKGGIQTVYTGGFEKGNWYDIFSNYDGVKNAFSMAGTKQHSVRKRMLSNIYSKSYLQNSATLAAITRDIVFARFLPRMDGFAREGRAFDVYSELSGITMDFVTNYLFGGGAGSDFIRDYEMREKFLTWYTGRIGFNFWPQEAPRLGALLGKFGVKTVPDHVFVANEKIEKWTLDMCDASATFMKEAGTMKVEDVKEQEIAKFPVVYAQMLNGLEKSKDDSMKGLSEEQKKLELASELLDHLAAGFDTSGITLCYVVHELSQRPDIQDALRQELLTLDPPVSISRLRDATPVIASSKLLDALPLLDAVVQETLRLRAAIPGPEPRITPPNGCALGSEGEYANIPGGVRISAQAHSLHRNPDVYENPDEWRPSRWIDADEEKLKDMRRWFWAFGSGGRMCVGSNLALYQMKFIIAAIYTSFTTSIVDDESIEQMDLYTAPPSGGKLSIRLDYAGS